MADFPHSGGVILRFAQVITREDEMRLNFNDSPRGNLLLQSKRDIIVQYTWLRVK